MPSLDETQAFHMLVCLSTHNQFLWLQTVVDKLAWFTAQAKHDGTLAKAQNTAHGFSQAKLTYRKGCYTM